MSDDYLTPAEFAALAPGQQHAVWAAANDGSIHWVPANNHSNSIRRYHREQVRRLLDNGEVRGAQ